MSTRTSGTSGSLHSARQRSLPAPWIETGWIFTPSTKAFEDNIMAGSALVMTDGSYWNKAGWATGNALVRRNTFAARVSDLLCMTNLAHASPTKEHDDNDDFQGTTGRAA
jgi:hypothetical protein